MKMESYTRRGLTVEGHRIRQAKGPQPPFTCPWASEGCPKISQSKEEHAAHIHEVHDLAGMKSRNIFGFDEVDQ